MGATVGVACLDRLSVCPPVCCERGLEFVACLANRTTRAGSMAFPTCPFDCERRKMVLKVQCDSCAARYKLDESRIKGKGARITCPKCGHQFVVYKQDIDDPDDDEPATIVATRDQIFPPAALASSTGAKEAAAVATPPEAVDLAQAPAVPRPASADDLDWRAVGLTSFKVKVSFGLVYDFSDVTTLKKYISDKKVQNTDSVSMDGKVWLLLGELGDLDTWFIDKWVELKTQRLDDEEAAPSPSVPEEDVAPESPTFDMPEESQSSSVQHQAVLARSRSADPVEGTLADDLFGDFTDDDATTPDLSATLAPRTAVRAPSMLDEAENPRANIAAHIQPEPPRPPLMARGEVFVLAILALFCAGLGWAFTSGALASVGGGVDRVDASGVSSDFQEETQRLFPSLSAAAPSSDTRDLPVPVVEERPEPDAVEKPAQQNPQRAKQQKGRGGKPTKGVKVSSISAKDLEELGDALLSGGDVKGAVDAYSQAAAMKPRNASYQFKLGRAYLASRATSKAIKSFNQALKLNPGLVDAHKYLGEAYEKSNQKENAAAAYRRYLDVKPGAGDRAEIEAKISRLG